MLDDFDLGNGRRIDREGPLDADARGDLADGEGLRDATATALDDHAFEDLVTFFFVLDDADVHFDGVARGERGDIAAKLLGGDFIHEVVVHVNSSRKSGFSSSSRSVTESGGACVSPLRERA